MVFKRVYFIICFIAFFLLGAGCSFHPLRTEIRGYFVSGIYSKMNFSNAKKVSQNLNSFDGAYKSDIESRLFEYSINGGTLKTIYENKDTVLSDIIFDEPVLAFDSDSSIIITYCTGRYYVEILRKNGKYLLWSENVELKFDAKKRNLIFVSSTGKVGLKISLSSESTKINHFIKKVTDHLLSDGIKKTACLY